jgi:hypothetical protein
LSQMQSFPESQGTWREKPPLTPLLGTASSRTQPPLRSQQRTKKSPPIPLLNPRQSSHHPPLLVLPSQQRVLVNGAPTKRPLMEAPIQGQPLMAGPPATRRRVV